MISTHLHLGLLLHGAAALALACLCSAEVVQQDTENHFDAEQLHRESSSRLGDEQDELAADVQQLVIEQTIPQVIELLGEVESIMDEATDQLLNADTGGSTIAAQTEIIEKIHAAAKQRQSQSSGSEAGSAMMDMMERMMGKTPGDAKKPGEGGEKGEKPGDQAGNGAGGDSNSANDAQSGDVDGRVEPRSVPKASGTAGRG
ncbi:MAG: hypothetical protein ACO3RV_10385, partial [Luteolibacter sp.]